jgi:predicted permease
MRGEGSAAVARGGGRIGRQGLLVAEVGLSAVLLIGAGLLTHSLVRLERAHPGYDVEGLVGVRLRFGAELPDASPRAALYEEILEAVGDAPMIDGAALASNAPIIDMVFGGRIEIDATGELSEPLQSSLTWVAPGYFGTLGIPMLNGRDFAAADIGSAESAIIVNRTFAERYFPGTSAVNQLFRRTGRDGPAYRIVGVVGDAVQFDPLRQEYDLQVYLPLWTTPPTLTFVTLLLRIPPDALRSPLPLDMIEERLAAMDAGIEVGDSVSPVRDRLSATLDGPRFNVILFGAFAAIALAMAVVGLYGVVSHAVEQRAREMGIRIAIGAHAADVRRLVLHQGMAPVAIGVVLGVAGAAAAGRVIAGFLYLVEPYDPPVFAIVPVALLLVALAAIWVPALRATRVDPVAVLRAQ